MSDIPWVLGVGLSVPSGSDVMHRAAKAADLLFGSEVGMLTDLGPEAGIDWALTARELGRPFRVLLPWSSFENNALIDSLLDEAEEAHFEFEGEDREWARTEVGYVSGRNFAVWELIKLADLVIIFSEGPDEEVERVGKLCRYRNVPAWSFDIHTGEYDLLALPTRRRS